MPFSICAVLQLEGFSWEYEPPNMEFCRNSTQIVEVLKVFWSLSDNTKSVIFQYRGSRPEVFCKRGVLRNFANTQENTCVRVSFLIKLQFEAWNFIKTLIRWMRTPIWQLCKLDRLGGFDRFDGFCGFEIFDGLDRFSRFGGFSGFDGFRGLGGFHW